MEESKTASVGLWEGWCCHWAMSTSLPVCIPPPPPPPNRSVGHYMLYMLNHGTTYNSCHWSFSFNCQICQNLGSNGIYAAQGRDHILSLALKSSKWPSLKGKLKDHLWQPPRISHALGFVSKSLTLDLLFWTCLLRWPSSLVSLPLWVTGCLRSFYSSWGFSGN